MDKVCLHFIIAVHKHFQTMTVIKYVYQKGCYTLHVWYSTCLVTFSVAIMKYLKLGSLQ
jgi:hypothetical protein